MLMPSDSNQGIQRHFGLRRDLLHMSHEPPANADARANWLPTPDGQFALIVRAYVPTQPILDGSYKLPNVQRAQ